MHHPSLRRGSRRGFTLVEILVVASIMSLVLAIAIPNLLRARHNANETNAIASMRTLSTALEGYRAAQTVQQYPSRLDQMTLTDPPYIPTALARASGKQGYRYDYLRTSQASYTLQAVPLMPGRTGTRQFFVDETGIIRASPSGPAGPGSPEIE